MQPKHLYSHLHELLNGEGKCICCDSAHGMTGIERPDIAYAGLPCQAFTQLRDAVSQTSARTCPTESHPDFATVMDLFPRYVSRRRPKRIVCEEVPEFMLLANIPGNSNGVTYLWQFICKMSRLGFTMTSLVLDHSAWCEMVRKRIVYCKT